MNATTKIILLFAEILLYAYVLTSFESCKSWYTNASIMSFEFLYVFFFHHISYGLNHVRIQNAEFASKFTDQNCNPTKLTSNEIRDGGKK
jgi:hypothetical protein